MSTPIGENQVDLPVYQVVAFCPLEATFVEPPSMHETSAALEALEASARWVTARTEDHLPVIYTSRQAALVNLMNSFPKAVLLRDFDASTLGEVGMHADYVDKLRKPLDGLVLAHVRISVWNVGTLLVKLTYDVNPGVEPKSRIWLDDSVAAIKSLNIPIQRLAGVLTGWKPASFEALWVTPFYICLPSPEADDLDRHAIARTIAANSVDVVMEGYAATIARFARFSCIVISDPKSSIVSMTARLARRSPCLLECRARARWSVE